MKRLISLFLALLSLCMLCSCNQTEVQGYVIRDTLPKGNGQSIKVIILSGQSNATGFSLPEYLVDDPNYNEYVAGYDNVMISYITEDTNTSEGFVPVKLGQGFWGMWFGPEVGMASVLSQAFPTETVYIIKYSYGGANLHYDFNPVDKGVLYKSLKAFVKANLRYLVRKGYSPEFVGFCWMQGEADSVEGPIDRYGKLEKTLFSEIRSSFGSKNNPNSLRIVDAGISQSWPLYERSNAIKRQVALEMENVVFIDTIGAGLTVTKEPYDNPDTAHYDAASEILLGKLFAQAILK